MSDAGLHACSHMCGRWLEADIESARWGSVAARETSRTQIVKLHGRRIQ